MAAKDLSAAARTIVDDLNKRLVDVAGNDKAISGTAEARDGKAVLDEAIIELQGLKARAVTEEQAVRAGFADRSAHAQNKNHTVVQLVSGKKSAGGKLRAAEQRAITRQKTDVLGGYRQAKLMIDDALRQAKDLRTRIVAEGRAAKAASSDGASRSSRTGARGQAAAAPSGLAAPVPPPPPPPATAPAVPAGWQADPTGRHQHRYWDGSVWTHHVADNGAQSIDPLS
jgi:hypothetical protein